MKASWNDKINQWVVRTGAIRQYTEYYMGYPTLYQEGMEFYLTVRKGSDNQPKHYLNFCRYNNNGWKSGGTQAPIEAIRITMYLEAYKILLRRVGKSRSFRLQMQEIMLPSVERMIKKEEEHLTFLRQKKAPDKMIKQSESMLAHLKARHTEYELYIKSPNLWKT